MIRGTDFDRWRVIFLEVGISGAGPRGQAEMIAPQAHIQAMKNLELSDAETAALIDLLKRAIVADRHRLSPTVRTLVGIVEKLRPEPKVKPLDIFIVAEQFRGTSKLAILAQQPHIPAVVCSAFSLELYFKCLIRLGRRSFGREHDLKKLFALIGREDREKIKTYWSDHRPFVC